MKLKKIIETSDALSQLANLSLPAIKAFELKKFINLIDEEIKIFFEIKDNFIKSLWEEIEWWYKVKDENIDKFTKEIDLLLDKDIDITIPSISINDIKWDIKTSILIQLDYIITE